MNNNSITVVCPTYNSSKYIEKTLDALLVQKDPADEIVFSDDGSSDHTVEILEEWLTLFEDKGFSIVILKNKHQGPGATRNAGIEQAKHEWISFLDADDLWKPEKILKIREAITTFPEKNIFLHSEEYVRLDGRKSVMLHGHYYREDGSLSQQLYRRCFFSTSAITLHKSVLKEGLFDPTLPNGQDYELWLRSSPYMRLQIIPEILGVYNEHQNSITAKPYYRRYLALIRILTRHYKKGGLFLTFYMLLRTTLSRQWLFTVRNLLTGTRRH